MQLIARQELTSAAASITFSSIPATFTDLYLVVSLRSNRAATNDIVGLKFNGSTSNRSGRNLEGNGSSVFSNSLSDLRAGIATGNTATASTFGNSGCYIPNYASNSAKSLSSDGVSETNATNVNLSINAHLWNDTSAVNSIELYPLAGGTTWDANSTATLYGILAGSDGVTTVS
jgi:hypothetical protein